MIKSIIRWSIRNRFIVLALTFFVIVIGVYCLIKTPVDAIPDLSDVQVIIKTPYPGQAPQVVEDQVTYPLATTMLAVPGAVTVRGYSFFGDSYVYIIFKDGTDLYWARSRVLEYLSQISSKLPARAKPELGPDATGVGWIYEYALVDKTGQHDLSQLTSLQNWVLKFDLQTVPGVAEVATIGGMVKQYQITVDPSRLRTYGLTISQVKNAVLRANQEVGGSVTEMAEAEYMIRATGYIQNIKAIENIPLGTNKTGTPILLSNIATIKLGPQMRRGVAELNGQGETVGGVIIMRQGENAQSTIKAVKARLVQIQQSLPKGVKIVPTYDRSGLISRAIKTLRTTISIEFLVVMGICLLFLFHFRSSLVMIVSIPIGILIALIIMYLQGVNANIMSLGGIAIAIGVMVDAAIIMVENMHKQIEETQADDAKVNRWKIAEKAAISVGPTLFFSLLITTVSFLPVFALQAQEGKLFAPLAYTKTYAMAAAAILAITLVPVLMGYLVRGKIMPEQRNPVNRFLLWCYRFVINAVMKFPKTILLIALIALAITYLPYSRLGSEFMPNLNEGDLLYMPTMLPGISIGKGTQILQQTDKLIKTFPEVQSVFGKLGRAETATDPAPITMIETVIRLKPPSEWPKGMTMDKLKQKLNQTVNFPGVTNAWLMPIRARIDMLSTGIKTPVGIKIIGPNLKEIQNIGQQLEAIINKVPDTKSVYADRAAGGRYIYVDINRKKAARFGLNIADVQEMVQYAIGGANITETVEGRDRYPVNLRYPQAERRDIRTLKSMPIVTASGKHIPLSAVAKVYVASGPPVIKSENAQLNGWVYVDITTSDLGTYVHNAQLAVKQQLKMPAGYRLVWSGQYEYMQRAKARLQVLIPLMLLLIFFLLYINSRNLIEVIIIMGTLPLAFIGGIWLMYFLKYNMSVAVGVGFIALAGVAVETGMILLNYLNQALQKQLDLVKAEKRSFNMDDLKAVILNGAFYRVRPIIMATAATFAGLLPIMMISGTGAQVMRRIAVPMIGGLATTTILTLVLLPTIYFLWKKRLIKKKA